MMFIYLLLLVTSLFLVHIFQTIFQCVLKWIFKYSSPKLHPASTADFRKFLSTSNVWNQANCKKLPPCEPLEDFTPPKVETQQCVFTHAEKIVLFSVWSSLEQITFGYFAHWGVLALLQLALQAQSWSSVGWRLLCCSLCWWCALPAPSQPHTITVNPIEPRFLWKNKQKHSWAWDTVQTTTPWGFPRTSKERDAEVKHLLLNEN